MERTLLPLYMLGLLLASSSWSWAAEPIREQAKAIEEITKLRGNITVDEGATGKPVICVDFRGTQIADAGLACLRTKKGSELFCDSEALFR